MDKPTVLIVDDHEHILKQLSWALREELEVFTATSKSEALEALHRVRPMLLTVDLSLSVAAKQHEGFDVLQAAMAADPALKAIVITSNQEESAAMQAVRMGAFDYFVKPVPLEELRAALKRAAYLADLERRAARTQLQPSDDATGIMGESRVIVELRALVRRVAETDFTTLILGESGVGKELVASAVVRQSARRDGPRVVVNCAAIPENLLESELFGHEKGSFTGAHAQKKGKFEVADGGTLFLDEIGDLSPGLQAKLLRFLQERTIERVGSTRPISLNVRVLAATNRDLDADVRQKRFRDDLYYRLKVLPIRVPPLRERGDDVLLLANYFLQRLAAKSDVPRKRLSHDAEAALRRHDWPGNVRELENVINGAAVTSPKTLIGAQYLEFGLSGTTGVPRDLRSARDDLERALVERALRRHGGVISKAARDLGVSRVTLYDLLEKHGLRATNGDAEKREIE
jgi:two-component system NtrC family response regulator